ncbi:MAG: hypothetical protein GKC01_05910 [Candidatus Methanofastidiosa archaeon]|nr:hypothetical protein [Candidatus Methanofastidiosa archaeon]
MELVGKTAVYTPILNHCVFASYLIRLKLNSDYGNPKFVSFYINSIYGRKYILSVASQQVGQANVNSKKLLDMPIPLPPLEEQQEIVNRIEKLFSLADYIEETIDSKLEESKILRQSILKKAFEGKLVPQDPNDEAAEILLEKIKMEKSNKGKNLQEQLVQ